MRTSEGKTTLARSFSVTRENFFDLEDPLDAARLLNPREVLGSLRGLVVIDEFHRMPELFPVLRVLSDRRDNPARFLILGSASPALMEGASETLAGRVVFIHMGGFNCLEVGVETRNRLWLRGGFPESYLSASNNVRCSVAALLHADLSEARNSGVRDQGGVGEFASILDHGGALSWADVEQFGHCLIA